MDAHATIIVVKGQLALHASGVEALLSGGTAVAVGAGTKVTWSAHEKCVCVVAAYFAAQLGPGVEILDPLGERSPTSGPSAALLLTKSPICQKRTLFESCDGKYSVGYWDAEPYAYDFYEVMHLLDGAVTMEQGEGDAFEGAVGDIFVVTPGARAAWLSKVPVDKLWVSYSPD